MIGGLADRWLAGADRRAGIVAGAQRGDQDPAHCPAEDAAGEMPGREVMGGKMLALAGLLLIIPGFVSDIVGILLLQPLAAQTCWPTSRLAAISSGCRWGLPGSPAAV